MVRRFAPAHFANATLVAMIDALLLAFFVIERAHRAVVFGERFLATLATRLLWLYEVAVLALDVCNIMAIDAMILFDVHHVVIHDLVVAETARIGCTLADWIRALELASSEVMLAADLTWFKCQLTSVQLFIIVVPGIITFLGFLKLCLSYRLLF